MTYTISQAAERFGITAHTLRFYDKEGLLPFVDRDGSGRRIFKDSDLAWIKMIGCFKQTGMSLKDIRYYLKLCIEGDSTLQERYDIMRLHKKVVEAKLKEVKMNLKTIDFKLWYYQTALAAGTESIHKDLIEKEGMRLDLPENLGNL